jgi:hypothetical protein
VLAEAGHEEEIVHVHIGNCTLFTYMSLTGIFHSVPDPRAFEEARAGIPVTTQRRFDVYSDVSA